MTFEFADRPTDAPIGARMTVLGVGGAGGNAVSRMIDEGLPGVEFVVANTDLQALQAIRQRHGTRSPKIVQIGREVTRGLGSGGRPEVGRTAIEESIEEVLESVGDSDLLFIAAGMGGGTGTGAAPLIARRAREAGTLTIAIVSTPFAYEAQRRMAFAEEGVAGLTASADTVIVVPNAKLGAVLDDDVSFPDALKFADSVLLNATRGISGILVRSGEINTDFADIRTIMGGGGRAILGYGIGRGEDAAAVAATEAMSSPLLDGASLGGSTRVLVNVRASSAVSMNALGRAVSRIQGAAHAEAEVIFGMDFDPQMGSDVAVTVIATGFEPDVAGLVAGLPDVRQTTDAPDAGSTDEAAGAHAESGGRLRGLLGRWSQRAEAPTGDLSPLPSRATVRPSYAPAD